jgi:hypothetical protein
VSTTGFFLKIDEHLFNANYLNSPKTLQRQQMSISKNNKTSFTIISRLNNHYKKPFQKTLTRSVALKHYYWVDHGIKEAYSKFHKQKKEETY